MALKGDLNLNKLLLKTRDVIRISPIFRFFAVGISFVLGAFIFAKYAFDRSTEYLAYTFSTGDMLWLTGFSRAYLEHSRYKKHRVFIRHNHMKLYGSLNNFQELGNPIVLSDLPAAFVQPFECYAKCPNMPWVNPLSGFFGGDRQGYLRCKHLGVVYAYRLAMKLPAGIMMEPPTYPKLSEREKTEFYTKYGIIPGKSVVLAPYTLTYSEYDFAPMFEVFAKQLLADGYKVFTNTTDRRCIGGTTPISLPMIETVTFCELAGRVISARSGLCDFLAFANVDLTVLYPSNEAFCFCSFSRIDCTNPTIAETIINPNTLTKYPTFAEILEGKYESAADNAYAALR
jgi:hypothetical protein